MPRARVPSVGPLSLREWHQMLTQLAVEAGADPKRARERMAQAAQVLAAYVPALPAGPASDVPVDPKPRKRRPATPRNPTRKRH